MDTNREKKNGGRSETVWTFVLTITYHFIPTLTQKLDRL